MGVALQQNQVDFNYVIQLHYYTRLLREYVFSEGGFLEGSVYSSVNISTSLKTDGNGPYC